MLKRCLVSQRKGQQRCLLVGKRWLDNHVAFAHHRPPPDFIIANNSLKRANTISAVNAALDQVKKPNSLNLLTAANKIVSPRFSKPNPALTEDSDIEKERIQKENVLVRCLNGLTANFSPQAIPPGPPKKKEFNDDEDPRAWRFLARGAYLAASLLRDRPASSPVSEAASNLLREVVNLTTSRLQLAWHEHRSAGGVQSTTWPPCRDISQIAWAAGVKQIVHEDFWRIIIQTALAFPLPAGGMYQQRFVGQDLSQLVWAVARVAPPPPTTNTENNRFTTSLGHFVAWAENEAVRDFTSFKAKELTPLVWGLSRLLPFSNDIRKVRASANIGTPPFWPALAQRIHFLSQNSDSESVTASSSTRSVGLRGFSKAEISTLAHAIATVCGSVDSNSFDQENSNVQQNANMVLDVSAGQRALRVLLDSYLQVQPPIPQYGSSPNATNSLQRAGKEAVDMSMVCWSCAAMRLASDPLHKAVEQFCERSPQVLDSTGWANVVWALARTKVGPSPSIISTLGQYLHMVEKDLTPQHIANITWAQAASARASIPALEILGRAASKQFDNFSGRELASYIWSAAILNRPDLLLVDSTTREVLMKRLSESDFSITETSTTLWAAVVLGLENVDPWLEAVADRATNNNAWFNSVCATVYQAWIGRGKNPRDFKKGYHAFLEEDSSFGKSGKGTSAHNHMATTVSKWLTDQKDSVRVVNEYVVQPYGLRIDMAIVPKTSTNIKPLAIEINGPTHYVTFVREGNSIVKHINGPTVFKQKMLERFGWEVVHVECDDWRHDVDNTHQKLQSLINRFKV